MRLGVTIDREPTSGPLKGDVWVRNSVLTANRLTELGNVNVAHRAHCLRWHPLESFASLPTNRNQTSLWVAA